MKKVAPYFLLLSLPAAAFWPLLQPGYAMAYDLADYFLPNRYFLSECFSQGIFPWWNPYSGLGIPFHADPQSGAFYPVAWFFGYFIGYDFYSINWEFLFHVVVAGWGMYRLILFLTGSVTAALITGIGYQLSGMFVGNAQHLTWVISAAWLPWVLYAGSVLIRQPGIKPALLLSVFLAFMTAGGYPGFFLVVVYLTTLVFSVNVLRLVSQKEWMALKSFCSAVFLFLFSFLLLVSPYLVSVWQSIPYITRSAPLPEQAGFFLAFTPQSLVSFFFPMATLSETGFYESDQSMINGYFGLLPWIFLAVPFFTRLKPVIWPIVVLAFLFLLVSLGDHGLLWNVVFKYVPWLDRIRFPSLFRVFSILFFLMAASLIMTQRETYRSAARVGAAFFLVMLIPAGTVFWLKEAVFFPASFNMAAWKNFYGSSTILNNLVIQSFIQLPLLATMVLLLFLRSRLKQPVFHGLLLLLVAADMIIATRLNLAGTVASSVKASDVNQMLAQQPEGFPFDPEAIAGRTSHEGDGTFEPAWYNNNVFRKMPAWNSYNPFDLKNRMALDTSSLKTMLANQPLVYFSDRIIWDPLQATDSLHDEKVKWVLMDKEHADSIPLEKSAHQHSSLEVTGFSPNAITIAATSNTPVLLTLLQNQYPGWKVYLDGKPGTLISSNICMMSVLLPAGNHDVQFVYEPVMIPILLWLSMAGYLGTLAILLIARFNRR